MSRYNKKFIPLEVLSPGAIQQLRDAGVDVDAKRTGRDGLPFHKFKVSAADMRTMDGIKFDSKLEMNVYRKLRDLKIPFERQPEFILQEGFEHEGHKLRPIKYVGDFKLIDSAGKIWILDAKGVRTRDHMMKAKMLLKVHGIEVIYVKNLADLMTFLYQHGFFSENSRDLVTGLPQATSA